MGILSDVAVCLFVASCLGGVHMEAPLDSRSRLTCPGRCVDGETCSSVVNDTDCSSALVCCVDEEGSSTEFADWEFTTQHGEDFQPMTEVSHTSSFTYVEGTGVEDPNYSYMLSRESDEFSLDSDGGTEDTNNECPGSCVPQHSVSSCNYIVESNYLCSEGDTCCLTDEHMEQVEHLNYEDSHVVKRSSELECPGSCVHPSHALFCEEILSEFVCPLDSKCCISRGGKQFSSSAISECLGQCLPLNMQRYCFPPNELALGPTTCSQGTVCCVRQPPVNSMPPFVNGVKLPSLPSKSFGSDSAQVVLGHLAIDESGTVYKVDTNGQIFPLQRLMPRDHLTTKFTKITAYPRYDGEVAVYSNLEGVLFQQFFPRKSPLISQPLYQFDTRASEHESSNQEATPDKARDVLEDIVIPEDEDEPPVSATTPVARDKGSVPPCPGSCMSYFLRFTCFRGYAIYDGFSCPGRSVCCARLSDIEEHEQFLKSLSPYFNAPPKSRESQLHRCGIKGRRDTPRVMGGKESLPGEWCWQVAVINIQNQYICGGAIIDNSWILTAAHCVVGPMRENEAIFVRAGVTDLKSHEDNNNGQTIRVLSTFIHHNFNSLNLDNNIALLRLQKPLQLGSSTCVVCLPTSGKMPQGSSKCTVTGYGFISADGDMSLKVREAQVPIIDDTDCMTNVTEALTNPFILPASSFCAGGQGQQDACQGDSGGPLVCEVGGFHELVGLVSWSLGCGRNDVPSIYVKIPAFMGWINQIIGSSSFLMSLD